VGRDSIFVVKEARAQSYF